MKPFITEDGKTIVTPKGLISPYYNKNSYANLSGPGVFHKIPDELLKDGIEEVLRQLISAKIYGSEKKKLIPVNEFYPEEWKLEEYEAPSIEAFFTALGHVMRRDEFCSTYERGDWVAVFGTASPEYRKKSCILDNKHFVFITIQLPNEDERRLVMESFKTRMAPAMVHCALIAMRYVTENKSMYKHFKRRTSSKVRDIWAPNEDVKAALRHLLQPLNIAYDMSNHGGSPQFAYTSNRNIKMNAEPHRLNKWVLKCDITGFFDACNWTLVQKYLNFFLEGHWSNPSDRKKWMNALELMMINPNTGGLYQGSPVSGALSNAILRPAVKYMKNFFDKEDRSISVYADDITVSQFGEIDQDARNNIIGKIRHAFEKFELPFTLKQSKTKVVKNNGRKITGIRINHKDELTIPRRKYRLLRSVLHHMSQGKKPSLNKAELKGLLEFARFNDDSGKIVKLIDKYEDVLHTHDIFVKNTSHTEVAEEVA
jgi:hypothetical protein